MPRSPPSVPAEALTSRLADLLREERSLLAEFLLSLADFDERRLWAELGHASLFDFLHRALGLSRGAAHYRKTAARLVRAHPEVIEPIRDGRLCITSLVELAKVITPANRAEVLPRFFHCSKREAAAVAAEICPMDAAPRRELVTVLPVLSICAPRGLEAPRLPSATAVTEGGSGPSTSGAGRNGVQPVERDPEARSALTATEPGSPGTGTLPRVTDAALGERARPPGGAGPSDVIQPLTGELRRLHVTVSKRFLAKLAAARAALSHARPGASAEEILEAGLDLLLAADARKKALVHKPRKARRAAPSSARVPAAVKREVWTRDQGRCQWKLKSGKLCGSTLRCELDHRIPRARGGPPTVDNLRVLCRVHNQEAARREFGDSWMDRFTRSLRRRRSPPDLMSAAASGAARSPGSSG